ncbi:hypothetical protein HYU14_07645 [Candidatus Woesearchaeota archaeon]|nr:hypothetical protein [Candidatus Woesearchaeota archaeon]
MEINKLNQGNQIGSPIGGQAYQIQGGQMQSGQEGKNLPERKFSTGAVAVTIWKNNGTNKTTGSVESYNTIKIERRYKDKQGNWQSSSYFRINDLPKAALAVQKAYEHLVLRGQGSGPITADGAEEDFSLY